MALYRIRSWITLIISLRSSTSVVMPILALKSHSYLKGTFGLSPSSLLPYRPTVSNKSIYHIFTSQYGHQSLLVPAYFFCHMGSLFIFINSDEFRLENESLWTMFASTFSKFTPFYDLPLDLRATDSKFHVVISCQFTGGSFTPLADWPSQSYQVMH